MRSPPPPARLRPTTMPAPRVRSRPAGTTCPSRRCASHPPRADDRKATTASKHKTRGAARTRWSPAWKTTTAPARFAGPAAPVRRRSRAPQHVARQAASRSSRQELARGARRHRHARVLERPTAPIVRDVAIGETITVADLAQKLALKGGDVVKALFKMGVMATITQTIDHDTAALVTEELGHNAGPRRQRRRRGPPDRAHRERAGRAVAAPAGGHHHGPRRPWQDLAAGLHPPHQGGQRRGRRHHPAYRRVPRRNRQGRHQLPGYAGPCRVHVRCARAAPSSPTSWCWWSPPTTA